MPDLAEIEARLDDVIQSLLVPLRVNKTLDPAVLDELFAIGRDLADIASMAVDVPRSLVGMSLFVFTSMLAEADHAADPEPILDAAWQWAEFLRQAFGPTF